MHLANEGIFNVYIHDIHIGFTYDCFYFLTAQSVFIC